MSSPVRANLAPVATDRLGWLLLIPLGCLVLGQALLAYHGILPVLDGALIDTDSYMRLNRVLHLHEAGDWFDSTYPRINPPDGHVQHWTRPLDAVLLAGALLLEPFLGFSRGLHVWGVLISPVCLALSLLALNWATRPVLDRHGRLIACLLLLLQSSVVAYSSIGRPDHHSLLFLLFILTIGFTGRFLLHETSPRTAIVAGAVAALGVWVSTEALLVVASALGAMGLYWLLGDRAMAIHLRAFAGWTTAFLAIALLLERGPEWAVAVETDRLSILHVVALCLVALFWSAIAPFERHLPSGLGTRAFAAGIGVASVATAVLLLFPELRDGPLGEVEPLYQELRLERIMEVQPLIAWQQLTAGDLAAVSRRLIQAVGIALLALPFLGVLLLEGDDRRQRFWVGLALPLVLFLALATYQIRWSSYAQILLVVPYSALVGRALAWIAGMDLAACARPVVRSLLVMVALFWPLAAIAGLPRQEVETAHGACPLQEVARVLAPLGDGSPGTVLALADYGPELLYRTPHHVLSIPNHRPQPGFTVTHRTLSATDERSARAEIARNKVEWILLCPSRAERSFFNASRADETLYRRLIEGQPPTWLHPIELPADLDGRALVYAVGVQPVRSLSSSDD